MFAGRQSRSGQAVQLHVEEDHHDVLEHILRGVGSKRLPIEGNVLLHFDSHPDLLLPRNLTKDVAQSKQDLLNAVSIENWILPSAYLGIINRIVWIHPPWSNQITSGLHEFHIGTEASTGFIRVTCIDSYFISEGIVCRRAELVEEDTKSVELWVVSIEDEDITKTLNRITESAESVIIDVDLDFFSTKNPFLDFYPEANLYSRLRQIYVFEPIPKGLTPEAQITFALESCKRRSQLLDELEDVFRYLNEHKDLDAYSGIGVKHKEKVLEIKDIVESMCEEDVDWLLIHNAGCTCDDTDLPHHPSDFDQIDELMGKVFKCLSSLINKSCKLVTMSRSSLDDFCPSEQVEVIQSKAIELVKNVFIDAEVIYDYKNRELE